MLAIETRNLTRRFGDFVAVNQASIKVEKGEVFGFLGPNGSGKTTVIKMLTGILPITEGEAWIEGLDVRTQSDTVQEFDTARATNLRPPSRGWRSASNA